MAGVRFESVGKEYNGTPAVRDFTLRRAGPRVPRARRAVRLRQVDHPAHARRASSPSPRAASTSATALVNDVPARDRDIAMVFQSYALYPHMTVRENLAFGLSLRKTPRAELDARVKEASSLLGHRGPARPQAGPALGRPAAARRAGPRHGAPARRLPPGRAAVQPRRAAAGAHARRDHASCTSASAPRSSTSRTTRSKR